MSAKETSLVSMVLLQIVSSTAVEESQLVAILGAMKLVSSLSDADFEVLINLFDKICDKKITYSKQSVDLCLELLCEMETKSAQN